MSLANEQKRLLEDLYEQMAPNFLTPLWEMLATLVKPEPSSPAASHRWSYREMRDFLLRAGDLISAEQAERRVLILENPTLPGLSAITPSLYAGLQMILPGEIAPAHRHSQCALRFVMEGSGAFTSVGGEKAIMNPFDLVLTPGGEWHDHGNPTDIPMIWLDGLDIPTVRLFDATFAEHLDSKVHPETMPPGSSLAAYGQNMRPMHGHTADYRPVAQPLFHYPFAKWRAALDGLARTSPIDPHLGHALEFLNPADGGAIMNTISAHVRLLPAGFSSAPRQSTDGTIFVVVEGEGTAQVGEREFALMPRDVVVVPSWSKLGLEARKDLVLFGFSDKVSQQKLGLYKEKCA
ncbi:gentisate 1,2-dioxygenase [Novosphingobium profundi]|uniref:gentisate 1,2-dioxygenase n=1 Tax=Novosphingobium profundi TaxID=1774954 RepID=UPI001FECE29D|nr:gentisate 1,2-dioxygenase [Novosphingobium profundi]